MKERTKLNKIKETLRRVFACVGKLLIIVFACYCIKDLFGLFYIGMSHINKQERLWVEPTWLKSKYPVFISKDGQTARYVFSWSYVNNESNPFFISSAPGFFSYYDANAGYSFDVKEDSVSLYGGFEIRKSAKDKSLRFKASLGRFETRGNYSPLKLTDFEMNGRVFRNCVVCDTTNCYYDWDEWDTLKSPIDKFVISKRYGLIYYRHEDGREFFRDIKQKKKKDEDEDAVAVAENEESADSSEQSN